MIFSIALLSRYGKRMYIFQFVDVLKTIKDPSCLENVDHLNDNRQKNWNFVAADQKLCIFQIIYLLELYYLLYFANPFYNKICQSIPNYLVARDVNAIAYH